MSSNILVKTIDEVSYFNKRIFIDITRKQKCVYLILNNEPILDITLLRKFLIERELNQFGIKEIEKLISLIDSFFKHKINYDLLEVSMLYYNYEYPNKGKGFGTGKLCYLLHVSDDFLVVNEADFNKKEPLFSRMKFLDYQRISSILFEIKQLFKDFLNEPYQTENEKVNEVKKELYNHIFKSNAFEVFEMYHTSQNLTEQSKTDLSLLFQLFTDDNLFLETIELKHYIKWLNKKYGYELAELKKTAKKSKPNIQRTNVYKEFKKMTLKQP